MSLDKSQHYVFRHGSDNQHLLFWDGSAWQYEFIAGGVLFDKQTAPDEKGLEDVVMVHGLTLEKFEPDRDGHAHTYSQEVRGRSAALTAKGIEPCAKHGLSSKNPDGTCEACDNPLYWDDVKGQEG